MQLIGVYKSSLLEPVAQCIKKLGIKRAWIVCGEDGIDEITTSGETKVIEIKNNKLRYFKIMPERLGLNKIKLNQIRGKTSTYNANEILKLFKNKITIDHLGK